MCVGLMYLLMHVVDVVSIHVHNTCELPALMPLLAFSRLSLMCGTCLRLPGLFMWLLFYPCFSSFVPFVAVAQYVCVLASYVLRLF